MKPLGDLLGAAESGDQAVAVTVASNANAENALLAWSKERFPLVGGVKAGLIGVGVVVLTFVLLTLLLIFLQLQPAFAVVLALGLALAAAYGVVISLESAQQVSYKDRLLLAMEDLQRMVRFGIPTMQALNSVSEAAQPPLQASLRNILLDSGFGVPLEQAMAREAHRVRIGELAMLAAILSTQASTGGNLSESVGNLSTMLRERRDNRAKMHAITAESRITLAILALVPVVTVAMQWFLQPQTVRVLFGEARYLLASVWRSSVARSWSPG